MKFEYKIEENDYLTYQLFIASKSETIISKRKRNKIILSVLPLILAIVSYFNNNVTVFIFLLFWSVFTFLFYSYYDKNHYTNHYKKMIKEKLKNAFNQIVSIEINDEFIFLKDDGSESKVMNKEILEINNIPDLILIRFKGALTLIIPKKSIFNIETLKSKLNEISIKFNINYTIEPNWKWK